MKKIIYLLFLTSTFASSQIDIKNFVVTANPNLTYNKGDRFDFKFDIKGTYDYLDLFVYYESESRSNLLGLIYWNRDRDRPLSFPVYTTKNTWFNSFLDRDVTIPGGKFILLIKYNGQEKRLIYPTPLPDSDNDGVPDINDQCPNEQGPASNNGCPLLQKPNLAVDLDDSFVRSNCVSCYPVLDLFLANNQRYLVRNDVGSIHFDNLEIRNVGNVVSNSAKVKFYFSINNSIGSGDKMLKEVSIPSRNINSSYGIDLKINGWDFNNNNGLANGNYFILIDIDTTNTNDEGPDGEADNFLAIPMRYESTTGSSGILETELDFKSSNLINKIDKNESYLTSIYNISGLLVSQKAVVNKEEEHAFIQSLPKGFYIIKNGTETYKMVNQ